MTPAERKTLKEAANALLMIEHDATLKTRNCPGCKAIRLMTRLRAIAEKYKEKR